MREPCVYMMANKRNGTIYTGVTSNLSQRVYEHRERLIPGFTSRYGCTLLVWYEYYEQMEDAIAREKQIKAGSRKRKIALIRAMNPDWRDLYEQLARRASLRAKRSNPHNLSRLWIASSLTLLAMTAGVT